MIVIQIGLVAPGDPFPGGDRGDRPIDIPGYMISLADSTAIKNAIPTVITGNLDDAIPQVGSMLGSSSRGPAHDPAHLIKPEIGAPGGSVSAVAGSGTGKRPFGGTSEASPMVARAAALLLSAKPGLTPNEVKAILMNNAEMNIKNDLITGSLAPISRIGGGEVRVDRALAARAAAWDDDTPQGALSFGFLDVYKEEVVLKKTVRVRNYSDKPIR